MPEPTEVKKYNAAVIVTSDTCFRDPTQDKSGPHIVDELERTGLFKHVHKFIINDNKSSIVACLEKALISYDPALVITIGGTGMCPRDVTSEATSSLYDKECSGIVTALHMNSLRYTPHAALSRLTSGIIGGTLVVNFPGKLEACKDCFACLSSILAHALEQVRFDFEGYTATHKGLQQNSAAKQVIRSPTGKRIELPTKPAMTNGTRTKTKGSVNQPSRSRSSSEVSRHKLTIGAIVESRDEISTLERDSAETESEYDKRITKPKQLHNKPPKQPVKACPKPKAANPNNQTSQKQAVTYTPQLPNPVQLPPVKILRNESVYPLIEFPESLKILSDMSANLYKEPEDVYLSGLGKAYGCVGATLAEDLETKRLVPPYSVSKVDGYVLHVPAAIMAAIEDVKTMPNSVQIVPDLQTFERFQKAKNYEKSFFCYQVNTGGRLPKYNYAVIPAEKTTKSETENSVTIREVKRHYYVRKKGSDIGDGDVMKAGTLIGPAELALIIAMGHKRFKIFPRPKIGVLSTGDEIQDFFHKEYIDQDSVVDMNGPLLLSLLRTQNYFVAQGGVATDDPNDILNKMTETLKKCDVLLVTGGASMGTRDHVKDVIQHMGGLIHFGRVNMKPGKPVAFASLVNDGKQKFIFSLPGNPVSAFVTTLVLVLPLLRHGAQQHLPKSCPPKQIADHIGEMIWAKIAKIEDGDRYRFDGRLEFVRAKILSKEMEFFQGLARSTYSVQVSVKQHSSRLHSLVDCDCLIMVDPEKKFMILDQIYPAIRLVNKC